MVTVPDGVNWGGTRATVPLAKFVEASRKLDMTGIEWDRVAESPLDAEALDCLTYMADVEGYTIAYLRDLLNTRAIDDPDVARFMTLWAYEELFHQEALERFLGCYGVTFGRDHGRELRDNTSLLDRMMMRAAISVSNLSTDFIAGYMTWGAINELTAASAYEGIAERTGHPVLAQLLPRIMKDERRHFSFYYQQARARLQTRTAQVITSQMLKWFWRPVGNGVKTKAEMYATVAYCYPGERGRRAFQEIDEKISQLPGLEWFRMGEAFYDEVQAAVK